MKQKRKNLNIFPIKTSLFPSSTKTNIKHLKLIKKILIKKLPTLLPAVIGIQDLGILLLII